LEQSVLELPDFQLGNRFFGPVVRAALADADADGAGGGATASLGASLPDVGAGATGSWLVITHDASSVSPKSISEASRKPRSECIG